MKTVYTTGEVAEICNISQQTVIRCFDSGRIKGFRVPGSKFRRVPRESLIVFMREHGIPLDRLDAAKPTVLVVGNSPEAGRAMAAALEKAGYVVRTSPAGYEAGLLTQGLRPNVLILDGVPDPVAICRAVRAAATLQTTRILVTGELPSEKVEELLRSGAADHVKDGLVSERLVQRVNRLIG